MKVIEYGQQMERHKKLPDSDRPVDQNLTSELKLLDLHLAQRKEFVRCPVWYVLMHFFMWTFLSIYPILILFAIFIFQWTTYYFFTMIAGIFVSCGWGVTFGVTTFVINWLIRPTCMVSMQCLSQVLINPLFSLLRGCRNSTGINPANHVVSATVGIENW